MAQAQTERDKYDDARRKDAESNLKSDGADKDPSLATAVHAARLPSDVDSFALQHGLSGAEAERVLDRTNNGTKNVDAEVANEVAGRTVFRPVWVETPAGVSDPLSPVSSATVPVPPDPDLLDPNAPNPNEPTGHVAGREREDSSVADEFANAVTDAVDKTDDTAAQLGDVDTPEVPVE